LGEEAVPVLRKEFAALKPDVPEAPTHTSLIDRKERGEEPIPGGTRAQQAQRAA
jgi:putative FMN reductase